MTTSDPNQPGYGNQPGGYGGQPGANQPGGYGNPSGLPNFPAAPPSMEAQSQGPSTPAPGSIVAAFWCYVAAAVISVIGALLLLGQKQAIEDSLRKTNTAGLSESQLQSAASLAVVVSLVITIIIAALFVFFAFKLKAGRNWARIVLTIVAILSLLSLLIGAGGSSILGIIGDLAAVVGAILSYLPRSNQYIAAVKQRLHGGGY
jgi:hypothetical protein